MKRYIITFYILLLAPTLLYAWDYYTYVDGLIDNKVTTVAVNGEMMFCGTARGGSRFDGARLESFLEGVEITKIALTEDNHIWVGARQGLWEGYDEEWTQKLSGVSVNDIVIDPEGKIWLATDDGILSSRDGVNWESYKRLDEQLEQKGRGIAASLSEISFSDLNWIKNYVTALALKGKSELYAGVHIAFEVGKGGDVLLLSGIGSFDGYRWKLLEQTLESRLLGLSAEDLLEQMQAEDYKLPSRT